VNIFALRSVKWWPAALSVCVTIGLALWTVRAHAQLLIGQPSGFSGAAAAGVKENTKGAQLVIDLVNAKGGVHGQKIELLSKDDQFMPKRTLELATELIDKDKVLALFLNRGTPHTEILLPLLADRKVPLIAPSTGAMVLHDPVNPWVFNVRATYQREAARAIEHLVGLGLTRIAVMYTDDSFGADGAAGATKGFEKQRVPVLWQEKFPRDNPDLTPLVQRVKQSDAQAVVVIASAANVAAAVKGIRQAGSRAQVVTLSNNASDGFIKLLGEQGRGVIVTQVFPSERSMTYALVREAVELARTKGLDGVSPAMMEGFAAAKVLVEGLRLAGPNPTPAKLRDALENIQRFDLGGLSISYTSTDHSGLEFADLSIIDASGKFRR
jgi:ABC-type branched-subunit amino acid transport system substrate-binding protein